MGCWVSIDGGGTKTTAILVNERLELVKAAQAGGVNTHFQSEESAAANLDACINGLLDGTAQRLQGVVAAMPTSRRLIDGLLQCHFPSAERVVLNEGRMSLLAGLGESHGFLVLSGTGSDVYYEGEAHSDFIGGMGMLLGDEGGGAYIGQKGLMAVIYAADGRGDDTLLRKQYEQWAGYSVNEKSVFDMVDTVYDTPVPRAKIASFATEVFEAARQGDGKAQAILDDAVQQLVLQLVVVHRRVTGRYPPARTQRCTVCGGIWKDWKGSFAFFDRFREQVRAAIPELEVCYPLYEPVVGGAVYVGYRMGYSRESILAYLEHGLSAYRLPAPSGI